ncbi:MAG: hypothetical protein AAGE18_12250 [Pseudomonadota bacterium]
MRRMLAYALPLILASQMALAGDAQVVDVVATPSGDSWRFDVTVAHADTGWEHYADGWEVLAPDGTRLGYRELLHPHVNEQPFTRSLSGVVIPAEITTVTVRAHDNVDGWGEGVAVELPR